MNIEFIQEAILIGVVGKKGAGTLDNGTAYETDRVELHCLVPFDAKDSMTHGQTVVVHKVQNYLANYEPAKKLIDQKVSLRMQMVPAKNLGGAPRITCVGFELAATSAKAQAAKVTG
jgi:hypothetical protein